MRKFSDNSERFADQVRTVIKKGWFSDFEIQRIHHKINNEQESNRISGTPSINKQKPSNQNKAPASDNRKATQPNNTEQTLTQ